jgi:formylglycine-generating enzyme required for sulfatase activity
MDKETMLTRLDFVFLSGGPIKLGTREPLVCRLEGVRKNETPERMAVVEPFWLNKFCVTNGEFEQFNPKHQRSLTSPSDKHPVTDVTFMDALTYCQWLSEKTELNFRLPTETEWVWAAAPMGWEFPYQENAKPSKGFAHTFDPAKRGSLQVDDPCFGTNCHGLYHMTGNVFQMTAPWYYAPGHLGAEADGAYYISKGGGFSHCQYSAGVQRRGIVDVGQRSVTTSFRLAHSAF